MDCSPFVCSKVLDVLRMRKRAVWCVAAGGVEGDVRVVVKPADREQLRAFVDQYFRGSESFIMDLVAGPPIESKEVA